MIFFTGLDNISHASKVDYSFISITSLARRKADFECRTWIMDSGAFSQVFKAGDHSLSIKEYAELIKRWSRCGILVRAVSQDYMCESFILDKLGRTVKDHQGMTIDNYISLVKETKDLDVPIMPVLQGYEPEEYATHVKEYGTLLKENAWVGVGSVCKRNSNPESVINVLQAILSVRPDLRLHGFGIKKTCLQDNSIRESLFSSDSMAWNFACRMEGRNKEDYNEALKYKQMIDTMPVQKNLFKIKETT